MRIEAEIAIESLEVALLSALKIVYLRLVEESPSGRGERKENERCIMQIGDIKSLRNKGDYNAALAGCCELLGLDESNVDVLRLRASIYALKKSYKEAFQDYCAVITSGSARIGDYYLAADTALSLQEYQQACEWLQRVVEIGAEIEDDAFDSAANFMLAYAKMQMRDYVGALRYLEYAEAKDPNISLPFPGEVGVASALHLRSEIGRRKAIRNS